MGPLLPVFAQIERQRREGDAAAAREQQVVCKIKKKGETPAQKSDGRLSHRERERYREEDAS